MKYLKLSDENALYHNLCSTAKVTYKEKSMALNAYIRKGERLKVNSVSSHLKLKREQIV